MSPRDVLLASIVVVIWGVNFIVVKLGTAELPPFLLSSLRFILVAALVCPFRRLPRAILGKTALLALTLGVGHFGLLFCGIRLLDTASAAITIQLGVPFSALIGALALKEHPGWHGMTGIALAFAGVALLAGEPTQPSLAGIAIVVMAALDWALANLLIKKIGPVDSLALNGWTALFSVPMLLSMSLIFEHDQIGAIQAAGWAGWGAMAYTAFGASLVAYTLWYSLIARLPMSQVVPFTLLGPVISVACGVLLLGESLSWHKLAGGVLTVLGVAVVQFKPQRAAG